MRVLSLSHRMQNRLLDNHSIFNAPNLADYDAIVFDVAGVFESVRAAAEGRQEFQTHTFVPVVNGDTVDATAGIADILQRRREEMQRALERGAVVIVYLAPISRFGGVAGLQGYDRYFLLPAPEGMAWDSTTIKGGEGSSAAVVDYDHPMVPVFETYRRDLAYRAYFNDRAPGFARHAQVFIRSTGGAPLGVQFPVLNGHLVFLPTPREAGTKSLAGPEGQAIVSAARNFLGTGPDEDRPRWVGQIEIPGLPRREGILQEAEAELQRATEAVEAARTAVDEAAMIRDLLWAPHAVGIQRAAKRCAELLGFAVTEDEEGDVVLSEGSTRIHLVTATSNEAVEMVPHYRLRQRLDAILERRARAERGLVIANGQRTTKPEERKREIADSLRVASEAVGYALITGQTLFAAVIAALHGASDETLTAIRERIATTNGLVTLDDLLGTAEPPEDALGATAAPSANGATEHGDDAGTLDDPAGGDADVSTETANSEA